MRRTLTLVAVAAVAFAGVAAAQDGADDGRFIMDAPAGGQIVPMPAGPGAAPDVIIRQRQDFPTNVPTVDGCADDRYIGPEDLRWRRRTRCPSRRSSR